MQTAEVTERLPDAAAWQPVTTGFPRRQFLRRAGITAASAFVIADGLLAYRAYDQGVMAEGDGPAFDAWTAWQHARGPEALVAAAILAANAHNTQPWVFGWTADRVDLYADMARSTGANDALDRELFVSLGCALENLMIAAPLNGYRAELDLAPGRGDDSVATIALASGPATTSSLYQAIGDRRSNRSEYTSEAVDASRLADMDALVDASVAPARLIWLTDDSRRRGFGELLVDATRAHTEDDEQSRASFAWWRSDWDEIQRRKDGLTIDGVGLPPLIRTLGKILPATSREAADRTFVERTEIQAASAAAFGVIVVDDPYSRAQQLAGGRLLQRLHLKATSDELGFQHMNQITERIDRNRGLGRPSPFEPPLAELVGPGALAAFRIGVPTVRALPSPRRPVEEVTR